MILGAVEIHRVEELRHEAPVGPEQYAGYDESEWAANADVIEDFDWNADRTAVVRTHHTWVLRSGGRIVLIDTALGNHKSRPNVPAFGHLETDYLRRLGAVGVRPEQVDLVVTTHLHIDHVGWHTRLEDDGWVPTFPNARYLLPRADVQYWDPENDGRYTRVGDTFMANVYADSITPILDACLADQWEGSYVIDENLTVEAAPGHTPGSCVVKLSSGVDKGVFIGDVCHNPVQFRLPHWTSCLDEDRDRARISRRNTLGWAAENRALIFGAHFGQDHAAEVRSVGSGFDVRAWRALRELVGPRVRSGDGLPRGADLVDYL